MNTFTINPRFVKDEKGRNRGVFLTKAEFDQLPEELDDYEDNKAFDKAENRPEKEFTPYRVTVDKIKRQRAK